MSQSDQPGRRFAKPEFSSNKIREKELLSSLIHKIGHEIGNPLTSIISLATIIERFSGPQLPEGKEDVLGGDKLAHYAGSIIREAWRISVITENLVLLLSQKGGNPSLCDVGGIIQRALSKLKTRTRTDTSMVRVQMQSQAPPLAFIDQDQFLALVSELIANAFHALSYEESPSEADSSELQKDTNDDEQQMPISVQVKSEGDYTTLSVDNVCCRPCPFELSSLFEPLITAYAEHKHVGLGLCVAAAIVERANGIIEIEETPVAGGYRFVTRVILPNSEVVRRSPGEGDYSVPVAQAAVDSQRVAEIPDSLPPQLTIYIVEDEATVASALCKILEVALAEKSELKCHQCSGEEALHTITKGLPFDIMLCDLNLAGMSGRHVFEALRANRPEEVSKFAFLTGEQARPETKLYLKSSGRPYLLKPFEPDDLIRLVVKLATAPEA